MGILLALYVAAWVGGLPDESNRWVDPLKGPAGWDGGHYQTIAEHGYRAAYPGEHIAYAFFPLWPMLLRGIHLVIPALPIWIPALVLSNAFGFFAVLSLRRLIVAETGHHDLADRCCIYLLVFPASYVLSMAYNESLFLLLSVLFFAFLRRRSWDTAALAGLAAGLTRAQGSLLVVAAGIEAIRLVRTRPEGTSTFDAAIGPIAAALGPIFGLLSYLRFVAWSTGDAFLPFRIQSQIEGWHGDSSFFLYELFFNHLPELWTLGVSPPAVLALMVLLATVVGVYACYRLPGAYAAYALVALAISTSAVNIASNDRYILSLFPLFWALAVFGRRQAFDAAYRATGPVLMGVVATAAFAGRWVP